MQARTYVLPMLLLAFAPACPSTDNVVGTIDPGRDAAVTGGAAGGALGQAGAAGGANGEAGAPGGANGEAGAAGGASGETGAAGTGGATTLSTDNLGAPCVLGSTYFPSQAVYNAQAPECSSGLCLKPVVSKGLEGVDTGPVCTKVCESDDDCSAGQARNLANPSDKTCITGYTCGVAFVVGLLCCKKICLCKDFTGGPAQLPPDCEAERYPLACAGNTTGFGDAATCRTDKITFSQGTGCQNDGFVEFCIPGNNSDIVSQVKAIDPAVVCTQGSGGRAGCRPETEKLCQLPIPRAQCPMEGPMPDALWTTVCRLAALDAVTRIVPTWYE